MYWSPLPAQRATDVKQKEEINLSLITDNTVFYVGSSKNLQKVGISKWILQGHRTKSQYKNQFCFCVLATNHQKLKFKTPFIIVLNYIIFRDKSNKMGKTWMLKIINIAVRN